MEGPAADELGGARRPSVMMVIWCEGYFTGFASYKDCRQPW